MRIGISHFTLIVRDIERTAQLFERVFDASRLYESGARQFSISQEMFLSVGGIWICLMAGEPHAARTYDHIAFSLTDDQFDRCVERLTAYAVEMRPDRPRVAGEGRSAYFYDYDNHLFELHVGTLEERLARYQSD